ncbi:Protein king tubby [Dictyocoela muelleri]|nr:Protein king tubby [Dictyocoela muelleri]
MAHEKNIPNINFISPIFTNFSDVDTGGINMKHPKIMEARGQVHRKKNFFSVEYVYTYENMDIPLIAKKEFFKHSIWDDKYLLGILKNNIFGSQYTFSQFNIEYYNQKILSNLQKNSYSSINNISGFDQNLDNSVNNINTDNINNNRIFNDDLTNNHDNALFNMYKTKNSCITDISKNNENLYIEYECSFFRKKKPRDFIVAYSPSSIIYKNTISLNKSIKKLYESGKFNDLIILSNKKPIYCSESNSYVLNFSGRVTMPSVKNFQLIHPIDPDYISLTFGKIGKEDFILDFKFPWTPLQAFAIALSALDSKIWCE